MSDLLSGSLILFRDTETTVQERGQLRKELSTTWKKPFRSLSTTRREGTYGRRVSTDENSRAMISSLFCQHSAEGGSVLSALNPREETFTLSMTTSRTGPCCSHRTSPFLRKSNSSTAQPVHHEPTRGWKKLLWSPVLWFFLSSSRAQPLSRPSCGAVVLYPILCALSVMALGSSMCIRSSSRRP